MSTIWNYTAIRPASGLPAQGSPSAPGRPVRGDNVRRTKSGERVRGEIAGGSAAEVRASLRRIGLQVIDLRPRRSIAFFTRNGDSSNAAANNLLNALIDRWNSHLRTRRRAQRSDLFDGLATMLDSGLPLLEAIEPLLDCGGQGKTKDTGFMRLAHLQFQFRGRGRGRGGAVRAMLVVVREHLKGGASLDRAMAAHPSWFDATEVAMVGAAQHSGNLSPVLRRLAEQQERAGELGRKLSSALAYPCVIAIVGLGVVVFLSVKTLPDLARILESAGIAVPALTQHVMSIGQVIASQWSLLMFLCAALLSLALAAPAIGSRFTRHKARITLLPKVVRRMAVAGFSLRFSDLLRTGVPVVEALRVLAPTVSNRAFRQTLIDAADRVERGEELSTSLCNPMWFDAEFTRLLEIGQASGELDVLLERLGRRYERTARRLIDQLAALLEPAVILALAALIGIVVMAAILPLTHLQEVLR